MRTKKTILNTAMSLLEEFVAIVSAFILPKLILSRFGSTYNGLTTSITQFLSCAVLLRAGIAGATLASLYKPLADRDQDKINSIMKATNIFMRKVSLILAVSMIAFAAIYPLIINSDFSWTFSFTLFLIIGLSTFAECFFGITYLILLQADQKVYIASIIKIICYIINIALTTLLILSGQSIHIVKLGTTFAFSLNPIILYIYVRRKYHLDLNVKPNNEAISQRWDSFWHQVSAFVNNNTDVIVLSIFANMLEVSVYSVYNLVVAGLKRFVTAFTKGIDSAFGNMLAKNEKELLKENLSITEFIIFNLSTFIYSCAIILITHFVAIYTDGITDVDYMRPMFAYILLAAQFFYSIRMPYVSMVQAAGKFKETKKYAIIEAVINITTSIILVIKFGLVGIAIGTFVALIYKTISFSNFVSEHIIDRKKMITFYKCLISGIEFVIIYAIVKVINFPTDLNYLSWIIHAFIVAGVSLIVIICGTFLFYRDDFHKTLKKLKSLRKQKKKV